MGKNILILTGSARRGGNSEMLADAFAKGAQAAGHTVSRFAAAAHEIGGCIACNTCWSKGTPCSSRDGFNDVLYPLLANAEALVLASPLYFCTYPAKLKAALDKLYVFGGAAFRKHPLGVRESALLVCAANPDRELFSGLLHNYRCTAEFMGWADRGAVVVPGAAMPGDVALTNGLQEAEQLGLSF